MPFRKAAALCVLLAALPGCSREETGPYFDIQGGGFVFNYRIAEATAGIVAYPMRTLPEGGTFEATFPNPAGGAPFVVTEPVESWRKSYDFTTPPLTGVKANTDYLVSVRLLDASGKEIGKVERPLRSELDQAVLPAKPLTIGPGYTPNPGAKPEPAGPQP